MQEDRIGKKKSEEEGNPSSCYENVITWVIKHYIFFESIVELEVSMDIRCS